MTPGPQTSEHTAAVKLPALVTAGAALLFAALDYLGHPLSPETRDAITQLVMTMFASGGAYALSRGMAKRGNGGA